MTIIRREIKETHTSIVPDSAICDACGTEIRDKKGFANRSPAVSRFHRMERNTPDNQIDLHAPINSYSISGVADLCEDCGGSVAVFIDQLSDRLGGQGVRELDEVGD